MAGVHASARTERCWCDSDYRPALTPTCAIASGNEASPYPGRTINDQLLKLIKCPNQSMTAIRGFRGSVAALNADTEIAGNLLGRYQIEEWLGEGATGVVYRAQDLRLGRRLALKVVKRRCQDSADEWGQLLAEARAASALNHPNICTIYEASEEDGQACISMEYVEGQPLSSLVRRGGLDTDCVASYGAQIAEALEHAHRRGIIHRDIKSANIMVGPEGRIKVLDFGLALRLPPEELTKATISRSSLKELGSIAGTLPYLAPEILRGKPATVRSDIWALGVVLCEMSTGALPFKGDTAFELTMSIMVESKVLLPLPMRSLLRPIVERCLEKTPARRYQSARDVERDLRSGDLVERPGRISFSLPSGRKGVWPAAMLLTGSLVLAIPSVRHRVFRQPVSGIASIHGMPANSDRKILVVAPFQALNDSASLSYVTEGLTSDLSAKLHQLKSLVVIPSAVVQRATDQQSLEKIARPFGINLAVTGVVQGSGDHLRISIALRDLADQRPLWTQEISGSRQQVLELEERIFPQLMSALGLEANDKEIASINAHPTESSDAYDLYLRGRDAIRNFKGADDISTAIAFYQRALQRDPKFALAWAGMADASLEMYGQTEENFWAEKSFHAAWEAVRMQPRLAEAHFALGSVLSASGHADKAVIELKRGLALQPDADEGYRRLGSAYLAAGGKDEAIGAYQKAIQLSPYYPDNYQQLGDAYLELGQNEKALGAYRRVTELEPGNAGGFEGMAAAHFGEGNWSDCIPEFQKALALHPDYITYSNLGFAYFYLKRYSEAQRAFEKAVEMNATEEVLGNLADAYRWSGQAEKAAIIYDRAIELANRELQVNPRDAHAMGDLALYYAKKGDGDQARTYIRRARVLNASDVRLIYSDAVIETLAGRPQDALRNLKIAFSKGYSSADAARDPELGSLQSVPEFTELILEFGGA